MDSWGESPIRELNDLTLDLVGGEVLQRPSSAGALLAQQQKTTGAAPETGPGP